MLTCCPLGICSLSSRLNSWAASRVAITWACSCWPATRFCGRASSMRRLLTGSPAEGRPEGGILALGLLAGISLGILAVCFQRLCLQIAVHHNNLVQARGIFSGGRSDQVVSVKAH